MIKLLAGAGVAALMFATAPLLAQSAPPPPPGVAQGTAPVSPVRPTPPMRPMPGMQQRMHMMVMSDRTLTRDDVLRHVREMFGRLDANKDGYVTRDELDAFHAKFAAMRSGMHSDTEAHGGMMPDRGAMFDRLDANHDGMISRQEFMAARPIVRREERVMVMRHDNAPGEPGMDGMDQRKMELRFRTMAPMHGMGMGMHGMGAHLFEMADANHDGRVSLQEAETLALRHFDRADLNHDGKITPDERRQAHASMQEHWPG